MPDEKTEMKTMLPDPNGARLVPSDLTDKSRLADAKPIRFSPTTLESRTILRPKPQKREGTPRLDVAPEALDALLVDLAAHRRACG